ncbi:TPA_asm: AAA family ATPase, partial [Listeria monocytogenes]|nr:AAA family ATPase [Listeria monocytogenes]
MKYIKKMHIKGLKNFKDISIEFNKKINILMSENGSRKSNILEDINIVLNQFMVIFIL